MMSIATADDGRSCSIKWIVSYDVLQGYPIFNFNIILVYYKFYVDDDKMQFYQVAYNNFIEQNVGEKKQEL